MTLVKHEICWFCEGTTNDPKEPHLVCHECNGRGYFDVVITRVPVPPPVLDEPPSRAV